MMSADLSGESSGPAATGQVAYTTPGTYTWVCPAGVYSVSVVCVGAGSAYSATAGGSPGGGGLRYKNNYSTTPGMGYAVVVGAPGTSFATPQGGMSSFAGALIANAGAVGSGSSGGAGGGGIGGDGGGNGGAGGSSAGGTAGAGGAGGYSGNGGAGGAPGAAGGNGLGGGGGGGGGASTNGAPGDGGGVGLLGQGANGAGGASAANGGAGTAGSAGSGKLYGGAGGLQGPSPTAPYSAGGGAVRIIWPGTTRQFPSTNTGDM